MIKKDQSLKQDGLRLLAFLFIVLGGIGTMIMTIIQFQCNKLSSFSNCNLLNY